MLSAFVTIDDGNRGTSKRKTKVHMPEESRLNSTEMEQMGTPPAYSEVQ